MINYYEYIQSDKWYARTESIRRRKGGRCECCCMRRGSEVHHRTYERLGNERDEDLLHVCKPCHRRIHKKGNAFIWPSRIEFLLILQKEVEKVCDETDIINGELAQCKTQ